MSYSLPPRRLSVTLPVSSRRALVIARATWGWACWPGANVPQPRGLRPGPCDEAAAGGAGALDRRVAFFHFLAQEAAALVLSLIHI